MAAGNDGTDVQNLRGRLEEVEETLRAIRSGEVDALVVEGPKGSDFIVRLPALPSDAPPAPRNLGNESSAAKAVLPQRRILVVDDSVDSARSMGLLLNLMWGQIVEVAHDGEEALEKTKNFRPDLILLDIGLPGPERLRRG